MKLAKKSVPYVKINCNLKKNQKYKKEKDKQKLVENDNFQFNKGSPNTTIGLRRM